MTITVDPMLWAEYVKACARVEAEQNDYRTAKTAGPRPVMSHAYLAACRDKARISAELLGGAVWDEREAAE